MKTEMWYLSDGVLLSHETEWNNAICNNMGRPRDYHTTWSKSDRQISYDITYMCNLKKKLYKPTYTQNRNRPADIENKLRVTKRERGKRIDYEVGINIQTLLLRKK